ncbi:glycine cleavage system H protein [Methylacidimicrobium cyclopophantes]|uniref:Glycine cleavage system H protein n=1 Tax=Methylacidimicrobium cyclopophantes TaxID=1041766 RepID=A0A5E6M5X0_9BACT|nr:glycine cleavage system protein GcvH [Methylacidimicrobium cyclopophantes]VVM04954.1 glycine cleavage system H protein [Methylacidimicrobium cyclopophantes]
MNIPTDRLYTESHEWLLLEGEIGTVGITDHAQRELSDVVFVELPAIGTHVQRGEAVATVESVKAASDVYSPVSGEVLEVNEALAREPSLINTDPYGKGWLFRVHVENPAEAPQLKSPEAYGALTADSAKRAS